MAPDRLAAQVAHLERHPEHGIVMGLAEAFVTPGEPRPAHYNPDWDAGPFPACLGTMLARTSALASSADSTSAWRSPRTSIGSCGPRDAGVLSGAVDEVVLRYRIHAGNITADRRAVSSAMLAVLRTSLLRRGAPAA